MFRKTRQKAAVIDVLRQTNSHPDAAWVYEKVRRKIPKISLGTVYRNLRLLKEAGVIEELTQSGQISRFDGNASPHYHFRCDSCGRIYDLDQTVDKNIEARVARETGFKVTHHNLELGGLCLDCQMTPTRRGK
jgi:Fur family peroxide stress response transcriptional regulator